MRNYKQFLTEAYTIRPSSRDELKDIKGKYSEDEYTEILALWDFLRGDTPYTTLENPLIFDDGDIKKVKVHRDTGFTDGKNSITDSGLKAEIEKYENISVGVGSGSTSKNNDIYHIAPGQTATKFYEQWASIGFLTDYESSEIEKWFDALTPDMLGNTDAPIPKKILKLYKDYKGQVQFQKDFTAQIPGHYPTIVSILLGSTNLKKNVTYSGFFSNGTISVVNGDIGSYYTKMEDNYADYVDKEDKENTADAVVFNQGLTVSGLTGGDVDFDENTGILTFDGGQVLQISMKKGKEEARIGKIKDLLTAWGVWTSKDKTNKLKSYFTMQHELQIDGAMLLDEGIIDWIKAGAKYAKEGISKLAKSISNIFKNISKGVLSVVRKFNTRRETTKLLKRYSRYLSEAKTDKLPSQEKQVEAIAKNPKALKQLNDDMTDGVDKLWKRIDKINEKIKTANPNFAGTPIQYSDNVKETTGRVKDLPENEALFDDVRMVFFNILSFDILDKILAKIESSDIGSYNEALYRFVGMFKSSVMGNTLLPVIKVYGVRNSTSLSHELYTEKGFEAKKVAVSTRIKAKSDSLSLGGLKLNVQEHYYVIYFYVAGELKGEGKSASIYYNNVRPTAYGGLQFKVEIDSTVDESTFLTQFGISP